MKKLRPSLEVIATVAMILFGTSPVTANPTPIGSPGSTLLPFRLKLVSGISIAEENLLIEDGQKDSIPSFAPGGGTMDVPCVRYRAQYQFENKSGKATTVKVGFPIIVYSQMAGGSYGGLISLKAQYGSKSLEVKESSEPRPMIFPIETLGGVIEELQTAGVVKILPESSSFVDLSLLGKTLKSADTALQKSKKLSKKQIAHCLSVLKRLAFLKNDETLTGQSLVWYTFEIPLPQGLSENLTVSYKSFVPFGEDYSFSYILSTAKFWNKQTKKLMVEIAPDEQFQKKGGKYEILPKQKFVLSSESNRYKFQSRNIAPNFDIYVKRIPKGQ